MIRIPSASNIYIVFVFRCSLPYFLLPCFTPHPICMCFIFLPIRVIVVYLIFPPILSPPYIRPLDSFLSFPSMLSPWLRQSHTIVRAPRPRYGFRLNIILSQFSVPRAPLYALIAAYSLNILPTLFLFLILSYMRDIIEHVSKHEFIAPLYPIYLLSSPSFTSVVSDLPLLY